LNCLSAESFANRCSVVIILVSVSDHPVGLRVQVGDQEQAGPGGEAVQQLPEEAGQRVGGIRGWTTQNNPLDVSF